MRRVLAVAVLSAGVAVRQVSPEDTTETKTLTVEWARSLSQQEVDLSLNGTTTLSGDVARALA